MKRFLILNVLIALLVLVAAGFGVKYLYDTRPKAKRKVVEDKPTLVEVMEIQRASERITVVVRGEVVPACSVSLRPEVSGRIVEQNKNLVPGGLLKQGEILAQIDRRDYVAAVEHQKAAVERAQFELEVETGRGVVAEREWELLGSEVPNTVDGRALALRLPHRRNAKAALDAAQSALALAQINLDRTTIKVPFNALVTEEFVEIGQVVSLQTQLATLVGTDAFWVRASVPVANLPYLTIPGTAGEIGSKACIVQEFRDGVAFSCNGRVVRLLGDMDPAGRMARVLIQVDDPLHSRAALPLLLNAYVKVKIEGGELSDVFELPRSALREGESVWLLDDQGQLAVKPAEIVWHKKDSVLVRNGLQPGDRIVTTRIATPIPGMKLRTE